MNWTQEPDRHRLAILDRLVHANRALSEAYTLDGRVARARAVRAALQAGCALEQVASALGVHPSEVEAVDALDALDVLETLDAAEMVGRTVRRDERLAEHVLGRARSAGVA
jgi:hypothetical protein